MTPPLIQLPPGDAAAYRGSAMAASLKVQVEAIEPYQPVVDINHWVFDASGRCINELLDPPPYYLSGLEIPRLKDKIQQRDTKVILVVGGSARYIPAIRAALKAGLANILVTDHVTAQLLLMKQA